MSVATLLLLVIFLGYVSLGIPDSLIGAAWPAAYEELSAPISDLGYITSTIYLGTIVSSFASARVIKALGTAKTAALSTVLTAGALLGFSFSKSVFALCLCSIPLGLGAGSIDTALNNYVASNYKATQMSFLHCSYGVGVTLSPYIMSLALSESNNWRGGYRVTFFIQLAISAVMFASLPLWKKVSGTLDSEDETRVLKISQIVKLPKARALICVFVGSCSVESVCLSWGSSFLASSRSVTPERAAALFTFYFVGMTFGRFMSGVISKKLSPLKITVGGQAITLVGLCLMFVPSLVLSTVGLFLIGMGNGPLFPNMTQITPPLFGKDVSQSVIGTQMGFSYISVLLSPLLTGFLVGRISAGVIPVMLCVGYIFMLGATASLVRESRKDGQRIFEM